VTHSTLILNADAQPVSVVPLSTASWQETVKLLFIDRANVIDEYKDWQVHSPSLTMNVPAIILLRDYVKVRRTVKFSKENIFLRDGYKCQYCDTDFRENPSDLTLDHVVPRFLGGRTTFMNVSAACMSCNLEKSCFMFLKPKNPPRRPTYWELAAKMKTMPITVPHESWIEFIGWDRSLVTVRPPGKPKKNDWWASFNK
jgi:5-methylcytosine-specific restriction endonuclease McrA